MLLNLPHLQTSLRDWQVCAELPKAISIGKGSGGTWATGRLKEYPPAMSGGLADGFLTALRSLPQDDELSSTS